MRTIQGLSSDAGWDGDGGKYGRGAQVRIAIGVGMHQVMGVGGRAMSG